MKILLKEYTNRRRVNRNKIQPWNLARIPVTRSPERLREKHAPLKCKWKVNSFENMAQKLCVVLRSFGARLSGHVPWQVAPTWPPEPLEPPEPPAASAGVLGSPQEALDPADQRSLNYGAVLCLCTWPLAKLWPIELHNNFVYLFFIDILKQITKIF